VLPELLKASAYCITLGSIADTFPLVGLRGADAPPQISLLLRRGFAAPQQQR
jgi:hypothetical protein